ncbi:gamma-glutamylcyclotransferase [Sphingomonas piscis]|uniref:Gamma-glutamylcyclotransferase n=1 Tax=Sphingomonas piscis TaxID=2714943 RepID=A0A6G7YPE4_9SPHN|nr:gamma-glutamylcyclotransferase family protein [Sphingomonas piscis]QIK78609.1 gamma-glutamylcyclotransferase [Sphingomonas piscis]
MNRVTSLFSYGTLQQPDVQLGTYGRRLEGRADVLVGFRLEPITIHDPDVVELSGMEVHTIAVPSAGDHDRISGVVFDLTPDEIAATDDYEGGNYRRVEVQLLSGRRAFVYIAP